MIQKRKTNAGQGEAKPPQHEDTSKPSAIFKPVKGRAHTVSIALPGSIIAKYVSVSVECRVSVFAMLTRPA